jgi:hypothetical protein
MILDGAETLFPGYFALTMATGVVSIACALLGMRQIAWALLAVNWVIYPSLWGLTLVRMAAFPRQLARDISDHQRAPGFFTLVAVSSERRTWSSPRRGRWPSCCGGSVWAFGSS